MKRGLWKIVLTAGGVLLIIGIISYTFGICLISNELIPMIALGFAAISTSFYLLWNLAEVVSGHKRIREEREFLDHKEKSVLSLWYLLPLLLGIIGGIIAYVRVRDKGTEMANSLLVFGIVWSIYLFLVYIIIFIPA